MQCLTTSLNLIHRNTDILRQWVRDWYCAHYACTCRLNYACHDADTLHDPFKFNLEPSYHLIWEKTLKTNPQPSTIKLLKIMLRFLFFIVCFIHVSHNQSTPTCLCDISMELVLFNRNSYNIRTMYPCGNPLVFTVNHVHFLTL